MSIPSAWPQCLDFFDTPLAIESLKRLRNVFIDQFVASFDSPRATWRSTSTPSMIRPTGISS